MSSFNFTVLNDSINKYNEIYVIDEGIKNIDTLNIFNQKQHRRSIKSINYYRSANVIQLKNMFHTDCYQIFDFMKRRVHFNFFLNEQIDQLFSKCQKFEFNF